MQSLTPVPLYPTVPHDQLLGQKPVSLSVAVFVIAATVTSNCATPQAQVVAPLKSFKNLVLLPGLEVSLIMVGSHAVLTDRGELCPVKRR
jgi:hypothetical protein